jgi:hypothetical protein
MTTKKQRRAAVAEKRARFDAESTRIGLEAQRIDREKRERRMSDVERAVKKRRAKRIEIIPDNLQKSMEAIRG